jgi:5-methylcytosine-specific restriction endonuclease McrA
VALAAVIPIRPWPLVNDVEDDEDTSTSPRPLPEPGTPLLLDLGVTGAHAAIYALLYRRQDDPPTMLEIRDHIVDTFGEAQSQSDRRVRELRKHFVIRSKQRDGQWRYHLVGWRPKPAADSIPISLRVRAEVLAPQRCAQCGRTPLEDGVKLAVDHKVPQAWGGGNEVENLQPLCEDCNAGKKDYYASYDAHADKIRDAIAHDEPHKRIGELLKAFDGGWVPTDLISIVASAKQFQEDYQKRTRELRVLGWVINTQRRYNEGARVRTYYRAAHWEPWGDGQVQAQIRAIERANKADRAARERGSESVS